MLKTMRMSVQFNDVKTGAPIGCEMLHFLRFDKETLLYDFIRDFDAKNSQNVALFRDFFAPVCRKVFNIDLHDIKSYPWFLQILSASSPIKEDKTFIGIIGHTKIMSMISPPGLMNLFKQSIAKAESEAGEEAWQVIPNVMIINLMKEDKRISRRSIEIFEHEVLYGKDYGTGENVEVNRDNFEKSLYKYYYKVDKLSDLYQVRPTLGRVISSPLFESPFVLVTDAILDDFFEPASYDAEIILRNPDSCEDVIKDVNQLYEPLER